MYAKTRVFAIVPIMSRPIVSPERKISCAGVFGAFSFTSYNADDNEIATSIIAPIAPIKMAANVIAFRFIGLSGFR